MAKRELKRAEIAALAFCIAHATLELSLFRILNLRLSGSDLSAYFVRQTEPKKYFFLLWLKLLKLFN